MTLKEWIVDLFKDERGSTSIKPVIAFVGLLFLGVTLIANSFSHGDVKPSEALVETVGLVVIIAISADTGDKFSKIIRADRSGNSRRTKTDA